jgi:hypothetical protein
MSHEDRQLLHVLRHHLPPSYQALIYGRRHALTLLSLSLIGKYELSATSPASFRSVVSPVNRVIAAPWLNPPNTIRDALISGDASISDVIISFTDRAVESIPAWSSSRESMFVSDFMSYLAWSKSMRHGLDMVRLYYLTRPASVHDAARGLTNGRSMSIRCSRTSIPKFSVTGIDGLRVFYRSRISMTYTSDLTHACGNTHLM